MIRSLRTGVSGLKSHQTRMDVTGNNIANVNTLAYKRNRATFSEMLGQGLLGVGRSSGGTSVNPSSVGLGVAVTSIDQNWSQGALENTNKQEDLALNGDGFFIARQGDTNLLTRAGDFTFDKDGKLVTQSGLSVQGWIFDNDGVIDMSALRDVQADWAAADPAKFSENIEVGGNLSTEIEIGESQVISTSVFDEQGNAHNLSIEFTRTGANTWDYDATYGGALAPPPFADVNGSLTFNTDGSLPATSVGLTWDATYVTGAPALNVSLDDVTQTSISTTVSVRGQDGYAPGQLDGYGIDPAGILSLNYSNGQQRAVFQIAMATVNNPNGLEQRGNNMYSPTTAAGDLLLGRAGSEFQTAIQAGALESSNVDLSTEFTEMIIAQRGYQASARIVTTSDEFLQETVSLKR